MSRAAPGPLAGVGVVFGGHLHTWAELLELTRNAEQLGARAVFVDGDTSFRPSRPDAPLLHSWSTTLALLARTERIAIGSMRIVSHWNAVQLATAVAAAQAIAPGRLRFAVSIGGQPADRRAGLHARLGALDASARTRWLDELLDALPSLWRGERVDRDGRFVRLEGARIAALADPPEIEVGGRGAVLLELIARRADRWDINLPPVPRLVDAADAVLASACAKVGRDPSEIGRSMWVTLRVDRDLDEALRREYRALNPWFPMLREDELGQAVVSGSPSACWERIEEVRARLGVDLPLLDLSGLGLRASLRSLERLC